ARVSHAGVSAGRRPAVVSLSPASATGAGARAAAAVRRSDGARSRSRILQSQPLHDRLPTDVRPLALRIPGRDEILRFGVALGWRLARRRLEGALKILKAARSVRVLYCRQRRTP